MGTRDNRATAAVRAAYLAWSTHMKQVDVMAARMAGEPPEEVARVIRAQFDRIAELETLISAVLIVTDETSEQLHDLAERYHPLTVEHNLIMNASMAVQTLRKKLREAMSFERVLRDMDSEGKQMEGE